MDKRTETALRAASAVLERKTKIEKAIAEGVADLENLIRAQIESERTFRRLEAAAAIGEATPDLPKAKKGAAEARAALEQASLRLNGFRQALGEMGETFVDHYDTMAAELPQHNAAVVSAFEVEWQRALSAWALVLGRRAAIERVLGQPMILPDPMPAAVELSADVAQPAETMGALGAAIKGIAGFKKIAERQLRAGSYRDPHAVYKMIRDGMESRGVPRGALLIAASLEPGRLDQLIELEYVRPLLARDEIAGVTIAAAKADQIEQAAREKEQAEAERRLRTGGDENLKRSGRVPDETEGRRKMLEAEAAEKNAELAGRSSSPGDRSLGAH